MSNQTAAEYLDQLDALRKFASREPWGLVGGTHDGEVTSGRGEHVASTPVDADAALIVAAVNALPQLIGALRAVLEADPIEVALGGVDYVRHLVTAALSPAEQAQAQA